MNDPRNSPNRLDPTPPGAPGQPPKDQVPGQAGDPNAPVVEIDGERMTASEVKAGVMRQKDYTQKTQTLADERKAFADEKAAFEASQQPAPQADPNKQFNEGVDAIKEAGDIATNKGVDEKFSAFEAAQEDERNFQKLMKSDERYKGREDILRDLGKANPSMAWEDIAEKYKSTLTGVNPDDEAGKHHEVVGNPSYVTPEKNILDMSEQEWEDYKNNRGRSNREFGGKFTKQERPTAHPRL